MIPDPASVLEGTHASHRLSEVDSLNVNEGNQGGGHGHGHHHEEEQPSIKSRVLEQVEKVLIINQFAKGPQLQCTDESVLKAYEPENDTKGLSKYVKPFLIGLVAFSIITQITLRSIGQIG